MDGLKAAGQPREGKSEYAAVRPAGSGAGHGLVDLKPAGPGLKERTRGNITVAIAKSFEETGSLRDIWQAMQADQPSPKPNADIDRYTSVIEATDGRVKPYVMLFRRDNQPVAMVIARTENHQLSLKLGYQGLLNPKLKCLNVVYGGVLGRVEGELCSIVLDELSAQLKSGEFDAVCFNYLNADSEFYGAVRNRPGFFTRGRFPKIAEHWRMSVPDSIDGFYKIRSRGHRRNLRQAVKKFKQKYPGEASFFKYTGENQVDEFVKVAAEVSAKTYQSALGAGMVDDEQTRRRLRTAAAHGWFDGSVLMAGGKPCAFQLGLRYGSVYYMVSIGYDPALNSYKTGTILFLKVLESLCENPAINMIDFYFGDAEYKNRYGTQHWPEACAYMFAPRMYPMTVNAVRCSVACVNAALAYVVGKTGGTKRIKRKWRSLLNRGSASGLDRAMPKHGLLRNRPGSAWNFLRRCVLCDVLMYPYARLAHRRVLRSSRRSQSHTYTSFHRSPCQLEALTSRVMPFVGRGSHPSTLSINIVACSTGAEAYTVTSELIAKFPDLDFDVCASDLHEETVAQATAAHYSSAEVFLNRDIPEEFVVRTFDSAGEKHIIKPEIRERISFTRADLLDPTLGTRFEPADIVFAQNVFFHLEPADAATAFENVLGLLKDRSALFIDGMELDLKERLTAKAGLMPLAYNCRKIYSCTRRHMPTRWWKYYYGAEPYVLFRRGKHRRYSTIFLRDVEPQASGLSQSSSREFQRV